MALAASGFLAVWQGEHEEGLTQIQESMIIARRLQDEQMMPLLPMVNAIAYISMGRDHTAEPLLRDALELFEQQNLPYFHIITIVLLGNVQLGLGDLEQARALYEEATVRARALGDNWTISFPLSNLGEVARLQGQHELARKYYEECEALLRDTGNTGDLARFVHNLGYIAQHEGDFPRANSQFWKSLTIFRRLGNRRGIAECLAGLGSEGQARRGSMGSYSAQRGRVIDPIYRRRLVARGPRRGRGKPGDHTLCVKRSGTDSSTEPGQSFDIGTSARVCIGRSNTILKPDSNQYILVLLLSL